MKFTTVLKNFVILLLFVSNGFSLKHKLRTSGDKGLKERCSLDNECASKICEKDMCVNPYGEKCSSITECVSNNCNFSTMKCGVSGSGGYCLNMVECESENCDIPNKSCNSPST